jgi:protein-tyrosine phosphatase
MAEGLLRRQLARAGVGASVGSAGLLPGGVPATVNAVATMRDRGIDIRGHVSHRLDPETVADSRLVLGMARMHVREACATYGAALERTFTLKELVRRGEAVGARRADESVRSWLARAGAGRRPADVMRDDPFDDVADPVGRPRREYEDTAGELEDLLSRLVGLLAGDAADAAGGHSTTDYQRR